MGRCMCSWARFNGFKLAQTNKELTEIIKDIGREEIIVFCDHENKAHKRDPLIRPGVELRRKLHD